MKQPESLEIRTDERNGRREFHVAGELTVSTAASLRSAILEGLEAGREIVLDARGLATVDLAGLQLVCSAHRACASRNVGFELEAASDAFWATAQVAGFKTGRPGCPGLQRPPCLWRG